VLEIPDYSRGIIRDLWWGYPGAALLGFVDDAGCPLRPVGEDLGFL